MGWVRQFFDYSNFETVCDGKCSKTPGTTKKFCNLQFAIDNLHHISLFRTTKKIKK
jgi:hypothetical protein